MALTRQFVEQRIIKNRQTEAKSFELRNMLTQHNILAGHGRSEKHVEELRRKRIDAAERHDLFQDYTFQKNVQDQQRRTLVAEAEDRMADELARRNAEQERVDQNRRRICQGSEELRVLKERLHAAKVNKERAQQLLEIEVKKEKQRRLDHAVDEHLENERLEQNEIDYKIQIEKSKQRERVKVINQNQIATKEKQREVAMQEYMKEKQQVQDLMDRVQREDEEERATKEQKRKESREMLRRFMIEQAERQEAQEQAEIDENNRIAKFAADKADREERIAMQKQDEEKEKERILLGMIGAQEAKNKEAEELENLRNELYHEEHEHKARERERKQKEKRDSDREEMKRYQAMQTEQQERKRAEAKAEEESIRDTLLAKFAEDDRIEQMNDHMRRMRVEAHKREAQRLMDMKKEAFEKARDAERAFEQQRRDDEAYARIVIEEERRKLIKATAIPLRDFLPKGTLQTKDDYDMIFQKGYRADPYAVKRPGNLTAR